MEEQGELTIDGIPGDGYAELTSGSGPLGRRLSGVARFDTSHLGPLRDRIGDKVFFEGRCYDCEPPAVRIIPMVLKRMKLVSGDLVISFEEIDSAQSRRVRLYMRKPPWWT